MPDVNSSNFSETDASNNQSPPNGAPFGWAPSAVDGWARAVMGAIKRFWDRVNPTLTSTGSAGTYVLTPANTMYPSAYVQGEIYAFKAHQNSQGADALNVNTLGALPIYKATSAGIVAIAANDIQNGQQVRCSYDSTLNSGGGGVQLENPAPLYPYTTAQGGTGVAAGSSTGVFTVNSGAGSVEAELGVPFGGTGATTLTSGAPLVGNGTNAVTEGLTTAHNVLGSNVTLTGTGLYFDGPSMAQGTTGTWWASGSVTLEDTSGTPALFFVKLWDGTTVIASTVVQSQGNSNGQFGPISLSGFLASPAGNIRISARDTTSTSGVIIANSSGNAADSSIYGIRVA